MKKTILFFVLALWTLQGNAQTNLLTNAGFDAALQPNIGNNFLFSYTFNGWTMTGNYFNVIRTDGSNYGAGPDNAQDGTQYVEIYYGSGTVYQDFTLSSSTPVTYGGYFSSRTGQPWTASCQIFSMPSNTLVSTSSTFNITGADIKFWRQVTGAVTLPAGTYRYVANIADDGNFDAAYVISQAPPACICGGNGGVDNDRNSKPDCKNPPAFLQILPAWICGNNQNQKVKVCHKGNTLCIAYSALAAHMAHGDYLGPCGEKECGEDDDHDKHHGSDDRIANTSNLQGQELVLFPNPAHKEVALHFEGFEDRTAELTVFDYLGKAVLQKTLAEGQSDMVLDLSGSSFSTGIYLVRVSSGSDIVTKRLVIW